MRQIVAILLLLLYSVSSTGATIYLHHCGKSTQISLLKETKVTHSNCKICSKFHEGHDHSTNSDCKDKDDCKDRKVDLKSDKDQFQTKSSDQSSFNFTPAIVIIPWILDKYWKIISTEDIEHKVDDRLNLIVSTSASANTVTPMTSS